MPQPTGPNRTPASPPGSGAGDRGGRGLSLNRVAAWLGSRNPALLLDFAVIVVVLTPGGGLRRRDSGGETSCHGLRPC
jgi:hypothetical protein